MRKFIQQCLEPFTTSKSSRYLLLALIVQGLYWYNVAPAFGRVDSSLGVSSGLSFASGVVRIAWTVLLFLVIPLISMLLWQDVTLTKLRATWLTLGDVSAGLTPTLICSGVAVVLLWIGSSDPQLQATYPWAGAWAGTSFAALVLWSLLRLIYYSAFEFFYRGFLLEVVREQHGLTVAIWIQAACSFLIHLGTPTAEVIAALPAGFLFAALALRGRSLVYPIVFHWVIGLATDIFCLWRLGVLL
ncbi:MAG: CPBP family intramembrane glutamic endopeptidase [Deinococcota bacterium]